MIGTAAALLIGSAVAAGGTVASAKTASSGAKRAAETQAAAGDKSLDLQREIYQTNRADHAPWMNTGGQAVQTLGALMGLPSGPAGAPPTAPAPFGGIMSAGQQLAGRVRPPESPTVGQAMPRGTASPGGGTLGQMATQSSYVTLRAPNGATTQVPPDEAEHYIARGAVRV